MKPEDIDKLFKERLGNSSPTPPADLWSRLQERMEEDQEKPLVLLTPEAEQKKDGKQRFMWIYSSVAATLSLLLAVGVVFYNINTGTPEVSDTLTKYDSKLPQEIPAVETVPEVEQAPVATDQSMMAQTETPEDILPAEEKNIPTQATAEPKAASNLTKQPTKQKFIAKAEPKALQQETAAIATVSKATKKPDVQTAIAANTAPDAPAVEVAPVTKPAAVAANANLNAEPVEITIKRAVASQTDVAMASNEPTGNSKKQLAKNIFKQVRNLASGDGVELEELGIRADRLALETQIGKQKISKVINL